MVEFASKSWEAKLKERRKLRDHYRAKFFSAQGVSKRLKDPFGYDPSPAAQIATVKMLQSKIKDGLEGDTEAFDKLKGLMGQTGFSIPIVPGTDIGRPSIERMSLSRLAHNHFNTIIPIRQKD